jgi:hypothetical protein
MHAAYIRPGGVNQVCVMIIQYVLLLKWMKHYVLHY